MWPPSARASRPATAASRRASRSRCGAAGRRPPAALCAGQRRGLASPRGGHAGRPKAGGLEGLPRMARGAAPMPPHPPPPRPSPPTRRSTSPRRATPRAAACRRTAGSTSLTTRWRATDTSTATPRLVGGAGGGRGVGWGGAGWGADGMGVGWVGPRWVGREQKVRLAAPTRPAAGAVPPALAATACKEDVGKLCAEVKDSEKHPGSVVACLRWALGGPFGGRMPARQQGLEQEEDGRACADSSLPPASRRRPSQTPSPPETPLSRPHTERSAPSSPAPAPGRWCGR
jgi:hypothetical protein